LRVAVGAGNRKILNIKRRVVVLVHAYRAVMLGSGPTRRRKTRLPSLQRLRLSRMTMRRKRTDFFPPIFWQGKFDNQAISVIVSVGAFHALLGKPLPGVGHMLQLLTMSERGRPRHIATFGGIATVFFDFFQSRRAYLLSAGHLRSPFLRTGGSAIGSLSHRRLAAPQSVMESACAHYG
jgi:hypothetical protein